MPRPYAALAKFVVNAAVSCGIAANYNLVLRFWLGTLDDGAAPQNQPLLDAAE